MRDGLGEGADEVGQGTICIDEYDTRAKNQTKLRGFFFFQRTRTHTH